MKNLILLNDDTNIKLGDTGTLMQFKADDNNAPVSLAKGQSATFRIKNEFGFLKSIDADTTMSGYVFQFDTSALDGLVPGTYQLELAVAKSDDDVDIFPDTGFVEFTISENALSITGEQLPVMSLDDFKKQAQTYVDTQVNGAETSLKNDFQKYVDGIQSNAINVAKQASTNATQAVNTAQAASTMANGASTMANQALGLINSKTRLEDYAKNNNLTDLNNLPIGMYQTNGWGADHKLTNYPPIQDFGTIWVLQRWTANDRQQIAVYPNKIFIRFQSPNNHTWSDWSLVGGVTKPLGGRNLLLDSRTHRSNAWIVGYNVNHQDNGTFMGSNIYKTSNIWDGLHYRTSDLVSRGVIHVGEKYTFSIYIKVDDGLVLDSRSLYFFNGDNAWERLSDIEFEKIGTEWAQISIVIQYLGKSDTSKDYIGFEISKNTDGKFYYSACPQLERGTTASDYHPAPEDTASDMTNAQQQLAMLTAKIAQLETDKS